MPQIPRPYHPSRVSRGLFAKDERADFRGLRRFKDSSCGKLNPPLCLNRLCQQGESVYRFYGEAINGHLFTQDENERNVLIGFNNPSIWRYEGVSYCADTTQQPGAIPVYRFYSEVSKSHLFTVDENEKNTLIGFNDPGVWRFEGVAYYAYPQ